MGVDNLENVIPYGNQYSFYSLIKEHLDELGIKYKMKILNRL